MHPPRADTTAAYWEINSPLRDPARFSAGQPHPLPITVAFIKEAIGKLRVVAARTSSANKQACSAPPPPHLLLLPSGRLSHDERGRAQVDLYRGMKNVSMPEDFLKKGGTELAPMSTTSDLKVAMEYSASPKAVLLRLHTKNFMTRGPDISFLSAFPVEAEYLFPPLTYLSPTGTTEMLEVDDAVYHVVDVEPSQ